MCDLDAKAIARPYALVETILSACIFRAPPIHYMPSIIYTSKRINYCICMTSNAINQAMGNQNSYRKLFDKHFHNLERTCYWKIIYWKHFFCAGQKYRISELLPRIRFIDSSENVHIVAFDSKYLKINMLRSLAHLYFMTIEHKGLNVNGRVQNESHYRQRKTCWLSLMATIANERFPSNSMKSKIIV